LNKESKGPFLILSPEEAPAAFSGIFFFDPTPEPGDTVPFKDLLVFKIDQS
jgi:hypothetical protein